MKYNSTDVFTPSRPAKLTFVERGLLNQKLVDAIKTPGKQILIYGHTGSGKTSLIRNKLFQTYEETITTSCVSGMKFEQLLLQAFDKFDAFFTTEKISDKSRSHLIGLESSYNVIKAQIGSGFSVTSAEKKKRIVPLQLTPQKLAEFFGKLNSCWVIEDFHKMEPTEKKKLSQLMKVFMDESVNYPDIKIIVIGAVGTAHEIVDYDHELENRVAEVHVPLLNELELKEIIEKGEGLLNINIDDGVKDLIVKFSSGLASVTHQLCLTICQGNALYERSDYQVSFDVKDFRESMEKYLESNSQSLRERYESVTDAPIGVNSPVTEILRAFVNLNKTHLTEMEIGAYMEQRKIGLNADKIAFALKDLLTDNRKRVLGYDKFSNTYSFSDPFFRVFCMCTFEMDKIKIDEQLKEFNEGKPKAIDKKREKERNKKIVELILSGRMKEEF